MEHLGIEFIELTEDFIIAKMPVDERTHQPLGLLHGGATAALIESIGSLGSAISVDLKTKQIVGIEVNANHIRGVKTGFVFGKGKFVHKGKTTHIWQVDITDDKENLIATGRLTVLIKNL